MEPSTKSESDKSTIATATLLTAVATLITSVVAVATLTNASHQAAVSAGQIEQGQVTDRYIRAVSQLGDPSPDVRLGSVYALGRLGRDSSSDLPAVADVLSAYVRNHSVKARDPECTAIALANDVAPPPLALTNDVRAAIQVLGGLNTLDPPPPDQDLDSVCLPRTDIIARATLMRANFFEANFAHATLGFSDLQSADLTQADLGHAGLQQAKLQDAHLVGADLTGADLSGANLSRADLTGANFFGANVTFVDFSEAKNVNLTGSVGVPARM